MGEKSMILDQKPIIFYQGQYTKEDIVYFKKTHSIWRTINLFSDQLKELFEITHPSEKFSQDYELKLLGFIKTREKNKEIQGNWIYYPWNGCMIHMLGEYEYNSLRTNRNQLLITQDEQKKLMNTCVGFLGLSIGSHFATGLSYAGIANTMKLAEFDNLSTSNLNRVRAGIKDVGKSKILLTTNHIYEINPYANLLLFPNGLSDKTIDQFVSQGPVPKIIFEAIDDFKMKIEIRLVARKSKIPVIMLTNLGDSLLIDIERYDLNPNLPLFNGKIGDTPEEILKTDIGEKEKIKFAIDIVGKEHLSPRILDTLSKINNTLIGRPQLYSTVTIAGGIASYLARKIILGDKILNGRTYISIHDIFNKNNVLQ